MNCFGQEGSTLWTLDDDPCGLSMKRRCPSAPTRDCLPACMVRILKCAADHVQRFAGEEIPEVCAGGSRVGDFGGSYNTINYRWAGTDVDYFDIIVGTGQSEPFCGHCPGQVSGKRTGHRFADLINRNPVNGSLWLTVVISTRSNQSERKSHPGCRYIFDYSL